MLSIQLPPKSYHARTIEKNNRSQGYSEEELLSYLMVSQTDKTAIKRSSTMVTKHGQFKPRSFKKKKKLSFMDSSDDDIDETLGEATISTDPKISVVDGQKKKRVMSSKKPIAAN